MSNNYGVVIETYGLYVINVYFVWRLQKGYLYVCKNAFEVVKERKCYKFF
jgi:hypothetical protein